ncbi:FAD/NAD(P)-binding domain-containing protein [Aspergillus sclerotioniger CBS 115572]|uniref:FAD/NAD(P)-binding domain-containing protein n=1 Tax=Aspergillus sclerotioniger CBS 115572 TaxID=1450535 RepID=A0A317WZ01_9EURO|nr:FAD/NAD(P)-binding domain-containing protein [Aspergillus sclerotioniger CBS 115572]PWY89450.1 FAD/NAD(P)-binding domain-containing protein [Aspergillus sclerotioniger CBS 115572]
MTVTTDCPKRYPATDISVLIVGAGVAGLMAALECWRNGHNIRIIERSPEQVTTGDSFTIGPSAIRTLNHWPKMVEENEKVAHNPTISFHSLDGTRVTAPKHLDYKQGQDSKNVPGQVHRHWRPQFHAMLLKQLSAIGVDVEYGHRAVKYFEDGPTGRGGIVLENGDRMDADIVIAADGVGSRSTRVTMGREIKARPSGEAMYRTAFPVEIAMADPVVRERFPMVEGDEGSIELWVGEQVRFFIGRTADTISWILSHKDYANATESWSHNSNPEDVLKITATIPDWPEAADRLIQLTPKNRLLHFRVMWRDPQPSWVSPAGRIVQIGDAAHTYVPASGNGATQGIEDAVSLATCLRMAGKTDEIPWALRIHNRLRFVRVSCLQKLGLINQKGYSQALSKGDHTPKGIQYLTAEWIWGHNPETYAEEHYNKVLDHLQQGTRFQDTNIPPGHVYRDWTIDEILSQLERGEEIELNGDWE